MTHGLSYDVRVAGESVATIEIPLLEGNGAPKLIEIYPTQDTLPQNLLKFYVHFSDPMQEGHALENTVLLRDGRDTVFSVFLDLNPELWNYDRTILTLWLDPGRIKRDLQPNMLLGVPLEEHTNYRLIVGPAWRSARGEPLAREYVKDFYVTLRDSLSPDLRKWKVMEPRAGTREPLVINFNESLDAVLLWEVIQILGPNGNLIQGEFALEAEESRYIFTPVTLWVSGNYMLQCESKVEDLAGNNLNRPFDRDIVRDSVIATREAYTRQFRAK
jgi:hypothetical protein